MSRMQAYRIHRFGGPEVLQEEWVTVPEPARNEGLIRVKAASLNPVDVKTREGKYPLVRADRLPYILGRDCAGILEETRQRLPGIEPGDAVYAFVGQGQGAYAEYVTVPLEGIARKPLSLDFVTAAAVPLAGLTAWQGIFDHGGLKPGQCLLIHGAAGGVGHFALQFAKAKGAEVIATASGDAAEFLRSLGADRVIDYKTQDFEKEVRAVDVVFDLIGGDTQERSWNVLKDGGALVSTLNEPSQERAKQKNARAARYTARPDGRQLAEIADLIDREKVRVHVSRVFEFSQIERAQRQLQEGHNRGKLVVTLAARADQDTNAG
ncbi:NADP-dependent oxidoreductase [Bordetella genomosp. 11]|uniref:Oxidoreductase n=1 Tax=Bordetella genomosp. 11 TaxID=1416808 RepID=A0A261UEW8_9BORD|nr:NADP-dependent oxidoreductase [Bordetella genomosp. 11]OZI60488.1 oxidoreductase [Bordetella genomosp. 11]